MGQKIHIEEFWHPDDGDNWTPAFLRAQRSITQYAGQGTPFEMLFHTGRVYSFHQDAEVISAVELKGERADAANMPRLYFPDGHGLRTHFLGSYQPDLNAGSQLLIDGLWLQGSGADSGFANHGIYADSGFDICNTMISDFGGDGFHVEATTTPHSEGEGSRLGIISGSKISETAQHTLSRSTANKFQLWPGTRPWQPI